MREIWVAILLTVVIVGGVLSFPWAEKYGPPAAAVPAPAGGPSPSQRDTNVAQRTAAPEVPAGLGPTFRQRQSPPRLRHRLRMVIPPPLLNRLRKHLPAGANSSRLQPPRPPTVTRRLAA